MQNSSNMSKSEGDKKLNVQISEEKTSPDNDNLSNKVSSPILIRLTLWTL